MGTYYLYNNEYLLNFLLLVCFDIYSLYISNTEKIIDTQPKPSAPLPEYQLTPPPEYQQFPEYNNSKSKSKSRIIIPFPFYDIDITEFPRIKFIPNYISDGNYKTKKN